MGVKFTKMPKISPSFNREGGGGMNHEDRETMALVNIDWSEHTRFSDGSIFSRMTVTLSLAFKHTTKFPQS